MTLPPVELLSGTGMALVMVFGLWKLQVAPRLQRRRGALA
jgi:hypothetical protein